MELCRQVAMEDGCIARHAIEESELDRIGRAAFRQFRQGLAVDFDLLRWFWAAGVTHDPAYEELARTCARARGPQAGLRGLPIAVRFTRDPSLKAKLVDTWQAYLNHPDVRHYGSWRSGGADFQYAFLNDCSIGTEPGEPLTDQLYSVPHELLMAWQAYRATKDDRCLQAFHRIGDYLVRIQHRGTDPRLDGAWMRGFDFQEWEEYGAPYDPSYGPYSAYTGWMNAFASIGLALYLLDQSPFPPDEPDASKARSILQRIRSQQPSDSVSSENIALYRPYTLDPAPSDAYPDGKGKLTDGVVDGHYQDGLSAGWSIPQEGQTITVNMTLDLGEAKTIGMVAQRYGANTSTYNPDRVEVRASEDGREFRQVIESPLGASAVGSLWWLLKEPVKARWLQFRVTKTRHSATSDFLFIGETFVHEANKR